MSEHTNWLVHDHREYDAALEQCEIAAGAEEWDEAVSLYKGFVDDLKLHMQMEDEVIYPMLEGLGAAAAAEVAVLREEHADLERLLADLHSILRTRDYDHFLESLKPLHRALRRHNTHEEAVLERRGGDPTLMQQRDAALARLRAVEAERGRRVWEF